MKLSGARVSLASVLVLAGGALALAVVGAGRAGSGGDSFDVLVQPSILTAGQQGFVKGEYSAASGPGSGTATKVVMTLDLPVTLLSPASSNCSPSTPAPAGFNRFRCDIGNVKAGKSATRFVRFTAPSTPASYTANGSVTFDNGTSGAGGGGMNTLADTGQTAVFAATDTSRAGSCTGSASTPPTGGHDLQRTSISGATAAPSLGLPCTWVFVGEDPAGASGLLTSISFAGLPLTNTPATVVIDFSSLSAPLSTMQVYSLPNYPDGPNPLTKVVLPACVSGSLPAGQTTCLLSLVPVGAGARAEILVKGLDGDPGWGMG